MPKVLLTSTFFVLLRGSLSMPFSFQSGTRYGYGPVKISVLGTRTFWYTTNQPVLGYRSRYRPQFWHILTTLDASMTLHVWVAIGCWPEGVNGARWQARMRRYATILLRLCWNIWNTVKPCQTDKWKLREGASDLIRRGYKFSASAPVLWSLSSCSDIWDSSALWN